MSWGTAYSGSNNIHFDFPPIMSDGRNFAKWQPGAKINENIRKEANITSNFQYRQFLTKNADNIVKFNQLEACDQSCYCPFEKSPSMPNTPFLYKSCVESTQPYGYENSDLKNLYLSREQLQCRLIAPVLTQDQYLREKYPNAN
jgi:hypothetical protein